MNNQTKPDSAAPGGDDLLDVAEVLRIAQTKIAARRPDYDEDDAAWWDRIDRAIDTVKSVAIRLAPSDYVAQGYWIVQRTEGATIIHNAESGDSCAVDDNDSDPTTEILRQLAQDAMTWGRPTARIVGMRLIDGVPVQVAKSASEFLPEILLVTYDEYLKVAALSAPKQVDQPEANALYRMFRAIVDAGGPSTIARHGVERGGDEWAETVRAGLLAIEQRFHPERFDYDYSPQPVPQPVEAEGREPVAFVLQRKTEGHPNFAPGDFSWMDVHARREDCPCEDENWRPMPVYTTPQPEQPAIDHKKIIELLRSHRLTRWQDDAGNQLPLVDHLTPPGSDSIQPGLDEIEQLADELMCAIIDGAKAWP